MMDPERGRCRRTDGRKWRCSKSVVPNQKYCERHMHRGRQGSRKHVEATGNVSRPDTNISDDNRKPTISYVASTIDARIALSDKDDLNLTQRCCSYSNGVPAILDCRRNKDHNVALLTN